MNRAARTVIFFLLAVPFLFLIGEGWNLDFREAPRLQKKMESLSRVQFDLFSIQKNLVFLLSESGRALKSPQLRGFLAQIDASRRDIESQKSALSPGQRRKVSDFSPLPEPGEERRAFFLQLSTLLDRSIGLMKSVEGLRKNLSLEAAQAAGRLNRIALWLSLLFASSLGMTGLWILQNLTLRKVSEFNTLLTKVNQIVASAENESSLIQSICDLAVKHGHLSLAWIGVPDESGAFRFLGVSGAVGYLEGLRISLDPSDPSGQGPAAGAWRNDCPYYTQSLEDATIPPEWKKRARAFGLHSASALPIRRGGRVFGVLTVYHRRRNMFDEKLRNLLEELVLDISRGFDRMDTLRRQTLLSGALASVAEGVFVLGAEKRIVYVNQAFTDMTGYSPDEIIGREATRILYCCTDPGTKGRIVEALDRRTGFQGQIMSERKNGSRFWNLLTLNPVQDGNERGVHSVCVMRDISELHDLTQKMDFQAHHDVLTGLPNRRALEEHFSRAIARAVRNGSALAVGLFDLDDFKPVNDTYGHEAGDTLLRELAGRLLSNLRENDFLARLGGDEFVVVIEDLDIRQPLQKLEPLLERLHRAVEPAFGLAPDRTATVDLSMGISLYPDDGETGDLLLREADAAMFQVKRKKHERDNWWQQGSSSPSQGAPEMAFDPSGPEGRALLVRSRPWIESVIGIFQTEFFRLLAGDREQSDILSALDDGEKQGLGAVMAHHLLSLFDASATRETIREQGRRVGKTHALVGVRGPFLLHTKGLFDRILIENMNRSLLAARDRYRILLIAEARINEDIQAQLRIKDDIAGAYFDILSHPLPKDGASWPIASGRELAILGALPGILSVLILTPGTENSFSVGPAAGERGKDFAEALRVPGGKEPPDPESLRFPKSFARSLEKGGPFSASAVDRDPRFVFLSEAARKTGGRSVLVVPVRTASGQSVAAVCLCGSYPNQFESLWMKQFSHGLEERWNQIWSQTVR